MDDFEIELKKGFLEEATQLLADAEQCFLGLEANPTDMSIIEKIFRIAHNLKGSSKAVGFDQLGSFTHEFESFFLKIKNKQVSTTPPVINLLLRCNDQIRTIIEGLKNDLAATFDLESLLQEIRFASEGGLTSTAEMEKLEQITLDQVRETILHEVAEETKSQIQNLEDNSNLAPPIPIKASAKPPVNAGSDESIRVSLARLEKLINFVGEMSILQTVLQEQVFGTNTELMRRTTQQLGKVCKEVQDISMSLRMIPVKQTFQKMQRIVRDTSASLNKKVQLVLQGEETELDKTVLESIGDPLVHLIRNAVDHGIESTEDRIAKGKPELGTVWLRAYHQAGKLVIEVQDDGGGIDGARLTAKAIEKGILKAGTVLPESEAVRLIFHPGFSTKAQVSEVSGRGVGMDVVKTNIEQLQGEVHVNTEVGKGTTLRIELPLTLAIIDGMVIQDGDEKFVIPLAQVHESVKPASDDLHLRTGIGEVLQLRGEVIPTFRLSSLIHRNKKVESKDPSGQVAMIFRLGGRPFAILVDEILRQQQVVVKQLGAELRGIKGYSGSAILGDGKPALILEAVDLAYPTNSKQRGVA